MLKMKAIQGVCLAAAIALIGACGGEEPFDDESNIGMNEEALKKSGKFHLRHKQTNTCVQNIGGGKIRLKPCSTTTNQTVVVYFDTKKCAKRVTRRYNNHYYSYCVAYAYQLRIGTKCIRATRVLPRGILEPAVLGTCGDGLSFWASPKGTRLFNWASRKKTRKMWMLGSSGKVMVKRAKNPYDEKPTAWAFDAI